MMDCNKVLESGKLASIGMLMLHWPFFVCLFVCLFLPLGFNFCLKNLAPLEHQSIELHGVKREICRDLEDIIFIAKESDKLFKQ